MSECIDLKAARFVGTRGVVVRKRKGSMLGPWRMGDIGIPVSQCGQGREPLPSGPERVIEIARRIDLQATRLEAASS